MHLQAGSGISLHQELLGSFLHWDWTIAMVSCVDLYTATCRFKELKALDQLVGLLSHQPEEVSTVQSCPHVHVYI